MASDWIKMRIDLQSHPKVVRILSAMRPHDVHNVTDKFRVIGGLHAVWGVFDTHSFDGVLHGYTPDVLDHVIGWQGFADAMIAVGWLLSDGSETLSLPEFETHNGQSGKRRAEDQKRKKNSRQSVRIPSAECPQKDVTREEKRREELITPISPAGDPMIETVLQAYHETLPKCRAVGAMTPKRARLIKNADKLARSVCAKQGWAYSTEGFWLAYFGQCADDPWLRGDVANPNNPTWKQNIDVLLHESRFAQIMDSAVEAMRGDA